jgi:hypothetical protein
LRKLPMIRPRTSNPHGLSTVGSNTSNAIVDLVVKPHCPA